INNYLNIVLEKKIGIPITLSIIYIHLASYLNFNLEPVNFPSHFLVKYTVDEESNEFIIIDPFNKGKIMDNQILQDLLNKINPRLKVLITKNTLEKANTSKILIRILNNLKNGYMEVDELNKIKIINEMILLLDKFNPDAIRDSGIILYRERKFKQALERFYEYIEFNPEAIDIDNILDFIRQIRNIKD
ncbi:MAG: transglutaminase family protein, partial [Candidatus Nitrosocosmicus sp.]